MKKRIGLIVLTVLAFLAAPLAASAEESYECGKNRREISVPINGAISLGGSPSLIYAGLLATYNYNFVMHYVDTANHPSAPICVLYLHYGMN